MKKTLTLLLLISSFQFSLFGQWEIISAGDLEPVGDSILNDVFFLNSDTGFIASGEAHLHGGFGSIFKTMDGGKSWQEIQSSDTTCVRSVQFLNPSLGYYISDGAWWAGPELFRTFDGGKTWSSILQQIQGRLFMVNENTGFAAQYEYVLKTNNAGDTWDTLYHSCTEEGCTYIFNCFFLNENRGWLFADDNLLIRFTAPDTWEEFRTEEIMAQQTLFFADENNGWLSAGYRYDEYEYYFALYRTLNGGATWTAIPDIGYLMYDLYFENEYHGWAAGEDKNGNGVIAETFDRGQTWNIQTNMLPGKLTRIKTFSDEKWAVGDHGLILRNYGNPFWVDWARVENSPPYLVPGAGEVSIAASISNPDHYPLKVTTLIQNLDESTEVSIPMENYSGDLWKASWPVVSGESFYETRLLVERTDTTNSSYNYSLGISFTTSGPVAISEINYPWYDWENTDTIPNPGDTLQLSLSIINKGSFLTIPSLAISLHPLDDMLKPPLWGSYIDLWQHIAPGDTLTAETTIAISAEATPGAELPLEVSFYSSDRMYWKDTVFVELENPDALDPDQDPGLKVYPNPASDFVCIEQLNEWQGSMDIALYGLCGNLILSLKYAANEIHSISLNLSDIEPGIYLLKVGNRKQQMIQKLIIQ
ncbi:MAG: T9SS type A sorting domain-containing protein [Bacteroidales bacterium]|nr:T9SS type A sorting domain-containing protein [Bacteroidales bacterium]